MLSDRRCGAHPFTGRWTGDEQWNAGCGQPGMEAGGRGVGKDEWPVVTYLSGGAATCGKGDASGYRPGVRMGKRPCTVVPAVTGGSFCSGHSVHRTQAPQAKEHV